ncbi:CIC11C00000002965 [Sungouiella intermedia]|uniref:CIC11C00000002965 n=1 Tax=Sungouiella intermedia TaxID=45354 RepID=A0A1L0BWG6_9ASCO|nr:CIC11C00000002965 [[Candida] intermedia]
MGLFTPKHKTYYVPGNAIIRAPKHDQNANVHAPTAGKANPHFGEDEDDDNTTEKKVYDKEKAVLGGVDKERTDGKPETETELNTRLNALLYHTANDSIEMYRLENNSLDLLGRLHYDDFDINDKESVSRVASYTSLSQMVPTPTFAQSLSQNISTSASRSSTPSSKVPLSRPRPLFERGVSFDTLDDSHHMSITRKVKHPEFKFRRNNKTYLIGFCNDAESLRAVEWVFQEMVIHGDTIVVFQVLDEKHYKFVDPDLADKVLEKLESLNTHNRRISMVYEVIIGRPQKLLKLAIDEYKPAMMIVGSHQYGLSPIPTSSSTANLINQSHGLQPHVHSHFPFLNKTSVSKYFLMFALVPVILVKPFYQHQELLAKPIDSNHYFQDMLANIDVSHTREKKKKHKFGFLSPSSSRTSSATNLSGMITPEDRGRSPENLSPVESRDSSSDRSRSHSRSQSQNHHSRLSKLFSL